MDSRAAISAGVYYSTMPRLDKFHDDPKMARDNALERNLKRALSFEATQPPTSVSISTLAYELMNEQPVPSVEKSRFLAIHCSWRICDADDFYRGTSDKWDGFCQQSFLKGL